MAESTGTNRRRFFQYASALAVGSQTLLRSGNLQAAVDDAKGTVAMPWPEMQYRTLGRTGFNASRLIFGCGAALMRTGNDRRLNTALDAGVNVFDVGTSRYYDSAERNMSNFVNANRDKIFLISKSFIPSRSGPDDDFSVSDAREAATGWLALLDESLSELKVDGVDAYYLMASNNTRVISSDEMHNAFAKARAAGKARFLGLSTHQNAQAVLQTAIENGNFDLAMIAITPAGWYDWDGKSILKGTPKMVELRPLLDQARQAGIGLIGMKAVRHIAGGFWGKPKDFDTFYSAELMQAKLNAYQRSYAFVLENGLDCVNSDIQSDGQLKENFIAAATAHQYLTTA